MKFGSNKSNPSSRKKNKATDIKIKSTPAEFKMIKLINPAFDIP